jgi:hypothetical protein
MQLPENYIIIRKEVKHARLRVSEDLNIRMIIPYEFSNDEKDKIYTRASRCKT